MEDIYVYFPHSLIFIYPFIIRQLTDREAERHVRSELGDSPADTWRAFHAR